MAGLPPAVMIHSLADGRSALEPALPVTLVSAPGAAAFAGAAWWLALIAALRDAHPAFGFCDVLDCADAPGFAAQALRLGQRRIAFSSPVPGLVARIAALGAECGAEVLPALPPALDLAQRGARRRLAAWLGAPPAG
ncbi:MAG TPA: hypothetical protein VL752_06815 [Acidisoma sp.]|jgi:hypothetical protein|uniref:hypothetical protein n=1 Tax=Acidisoma sp. TaxID=1872115 RepID=UPI002CC606CE|nr:hypothetical protein [Acidisoma sp.]HTI00644.1 hypothetical protein [Acidisoma sp.]